MKLLRLAVAMAGAVLLAAPVFAQVSTLQGNVTGNDGKPVVGATIRFHRLDMKWDQQIKTDKHGHYIHTGVPLGGDYDITLEMDGKEVSSLNKVHASLSGDQSLDFDLRKLTGKNSAQALAQQAIEKGAITDDLKRQLSPEQLAQVQKQITEQSGKIKKQKQLNDAFNDGMTAMQAITPQMPTDAKTAQYQIAVTAFEKAAETDPTQAPVYSNLGDAYAGLARGKTGAEFDDAMSKSLAAYTKAIELSPNDPASHNNYALALAQAKKFPEAEAELKKAADMDPASAFTRYYNLGAVLSNNGQADQAAKAFKQAIDAAPDNPGNANAYYQYGLSLAAQATVDKDGKVVPVPGTVEALQKYLALAPDGPNAQSCKEMIAQLGASVETNYKNPTAPQKKKK